MTAVRPTVIVIDDDVSVREALRGLLETVALAVKLFGSTQEFLDSEPPDAPCCLIVDIRLPGLSGLDFQRQLADSRVRLPIIFITGHGDIQMSVQAMKAGAVEFLTKPFRNQDLLDAVRVALDRDEARRNEDRVVAELRERHRTLTPREQQVMALVADGRANKQAAAEIGISEMTVRVHRGQVMKKMKARSLAELVRMADRLKSANTK
jgi:FixJ family two-component response regulator